MKTKKSTRLPKIEKILVEAGQHIKLARLRRKLGVQQVAERANISRMTLFHIEKGKPSVAMGAYAQVLFVLGLENDLLKLAGEDPLGKRLQDANLLVKERAPKKSKL
jgi:transcriptional regulator with XRE-family HTH domain